LDFWIFFERAGLKSMVESVIGKRAMRSKIFSLLRFGRDLSGQKRLTI
jgi:hypothetical protein